MALHKAHIPGFGNWDVVNNNAIITEYFEMARAGREKREGNINNHVEFHTERGPAIHKISNIQDSNTDIRNEKIQRYAKRGRDSTARQTEKMLIKQSTSSSVAPGTMRASNGHVLMHQGPTSHNVAVHQRVQATSRATISTSFVPVEKEVYRLMGTKNDASQRRLKNRTDMNSSIWSWKESGGNRSPSPSYTKPINVRKELRRSRTPSPSNRPSNVQKEYGRSITPNALPLRPGSEKLSSSKNKKKKPLPKFGDWDLNDPSAGIAFTSIFDDARKEKNSAASDDKTSAQMDAVAPVDEDLYKQPSYSHKKRGERLISFLAKIFRGKMICQ